MAAAKKSNFHFQSTVATVKSALVNTVVFIPDDVVEALPPGRVRVEGTFNDAPFALAVQHQKGGRYFFSMSAALRRAAGVKAGGAVTVRFSVVDPDKLHVPEELEAVLAQDPAGKKEWDKITLGMQRSLIHYITSVKNVDSRIKRALFLVNKAKTGAYDPARRRAAAKRK